MNDYGQCVILLWVPLSAVTMWEGRVDHENLQPLLVLFQTGGEELRLTELRFYVPRDTK